MVRKFDYSFRDMLPLIEAGTCLFMLKARANNLSNELGISQNIVYDRFFFDISV